LSGHAQITDSQANNSDPQRNLDACSAAGNPSCPHSLNDIEIVFDNAAQQAGFGITDTGHELALGNGTYLEISTMLHYVPLDAQSKS
jgi:hypothetical protein